MKQNFKNFSKVVLSIFIIIIMNVSSSLACTRVLLENKYGINIGRNMDWAGAEYAKHKLLILPRGIERTGEVSGNSAKWTSKYGSLVMTMYDLGVVGGINEKGLNVEALYLVASDYGIRNEKITGINIAIYSQYILDNFASVKEAIAYLKANELQLVSLTLPGFDKPAGLHFAIADNSGDNAIIEYIDGKLRIYNDKNYKILTNDPAYNEQLKNLKQYKNYGGSLEIPSGFTPSDRFVRTTYNLDLAVEHKNSNKNLKMLGDIMANAAQPDIKNVRPDATGPESSATSYTSVADLTNLMFYVTFLDNHSVLKVDIKKLNFSKNSPEMMFDIEKNNFHGDITDKFQKLQKPFEFLNIVEYEKMTPQERAKVLGIID